MDIIVNLWWLWLIISVLSFGCVCYNQFRRMRGMLKGNDEAFGKNLGSMVLFVFLTSVFSSLFFISLIFIIIAHVKE